MCCNREKTKQISEKVQYAKRIVFKEFQNLKISNISMTAFKIPARKIISLLPSKILARIWMFFIRINLQLDKTIVSFNNLRTKINWVNQKLNLITMTLYLNQKMNTIKNIKCRRIVTLIWRVEEAIDPTKNCFKAAIISLLKEKI